MTKLLKRAVVKVQALPEAEQDRLASLLLQEIEPPPRTRSTDVNCRPVWEEIAVIAAEEPEGVWDALPEDGAAEHDHYLYGTPKRSA